MRLLIALIAMAGVMTRVSVMPPLEPTGGSGATLATLGATLCHQDDGSDHGAPVTSVSCEHCDLCGVVVPITPIPSVLPVLPMRTVLVLPNGLKGDSRPRAPPDPAHGPRAPPVLV